MNTIGMDAESAMIGEAREGEIVALSEDDMTAIQAQAEALVAERQAVLASLAQSIQTKYTERSGRRSMKEREWLESMKLYLGSLSADRSTLQDASNPFARPSGANNKPKHNLVRSKCLVAVAQAVASQFAGGDKNWDIHPTPVPEGGDPKALEVNAANMEREIEDQLTEEKYGYKSRQALQDRVILGTGILKGPLPARNAKMSYSIFDDGTGAPIPIPDYRVRNRPILEKVNPWMFFPDDTVNDIKSATDAIELHPMSKVEVAKLRKNPGFFPEAIDSLLQADPITYTNDTFTEYSSLTNSGVNFLQNKYAVLEYHGPLTVDELGSLGIEPSYEALGDVYFGEVWVCQGLVLRVELEAISGLYELPYMVCPWEQDPNSIFGFGLPQMIKDPQRIAQVTLDMILENASVSSGPISIINKQYIEPFDGSWEINPLKMFGTTTDAYDIGDVSKAFTFINVPNQTGALFPVLQFAREVAQEESSVPSYATLQSAQTGTDSATGLAILQQNDTKVSDHHNEMWDDMVVEPLIRRMYHFNMQYLPKPENIGDFDIDVKSSSEYRNKQLFIRDIEKISVEAAQNPELAKVINMDALQRVRLSMMHIPSNTIIRTPEEIATIEEQQAQNPPPPDPALLKMQADMAKIEVDREKIALERERMQFEMQFQQRREEMNHAERMGANYMRELEVQARTVESMANREIELMKLAQKDGVDQAWVMAELQKSQLRADTDKFLGGLKAESSFRDQALFAAELKHSAKFGKGV